MVKEDVYGRNLDDFLIARGFKPELSGYLFIKTAIELVADNPEYYKKDVTHRLYPDLSRKIRGQEYDASIVSNRITYAVETSNNKKYFNMTPRGAVFTLVTEWLKCTRPVEKRQ